MKQTKKEGGRFKECLANSLDSALEKKEMGRKKEHFTVTRTKKKQKTKVLIGFLGEVFSNIEIDRSTIKLRQPFRKKMLIFCCGEETDKHTVGHSITLYV